MKARKLLAVAALLACTAVASTAKAGVTLGIGIGIPAYPYHRYYPYYRPYGVGVYVAPAPVYYYPPPPAYYVPPPAYAAPAYPAPAYPQPAPTTQQYYYADDTPGQRDGPPTADVCSIAGNRSSAALAKSRTRPLSGFWQTGAGCRSTSCPH